MTVGRWILVILGVLVLLVVLAVPIILLFAQPPPNNYWLAAVRDASIVYASLFMCVGALTFIVLTAAMTMLVFLVRDRIAPALEKADDTMQTVRGTATFVSESVVAPIIKVAGAAAGTRAIVQSLLRQKP